MRWLLRVMLSSREARAALQLVTDEALAKTRVLFNRVTGSPEVRRAVLLETVPALIGYYAEGSAALAADQYEEVRAKTKAADAYKSEMFIADRTVKIRRAVAWSAAPMFVGLNADAAGRLEGVVQYETARPFRDTILGNTRKDSSAVGWVRVTSGSACKFCSMLASGSAVYSEDGAAFAAHPNCSCSAQPVFVGNRKGPEASVMQYRASQKSRTQKQKDELRSYLNTYFQDSPG